MPVPPQRTTAGEGDCTHAHGKPVRMTWAQLLKRVFDIDIERCACGGKLKLVAVIEEPAVIDPVAAWGYIAAYAKRAFESPIPASEFHKYMFLKILLFIRYLRRTARHVAMDRGMA